MTDDRDLVGLSRQVLYEFEMIEFLAKRLVDLVMGVPQPSWKERFDTPEPLVRHTFEANAMLESLLIHVRALTIFLFEPAPPRDPDARSGRRAKPRKLRDGFAEDYFNDPYEWRNRNVRGNRPSILKASDLNRVSREIAHITYERASFTEGGSNWNSFALYAALAEVMERFDDKVDRSKVCEGFHVRVAAALPPRQPPPPHQRQPYQPGYYTSGLPPWEVATQGLRTEDH